MTPNLVLDKILGVSSDATQQQIRTAYKRSGHKEL